MARPKKSEPGINRERVLAAAAALFRERGFEGTTTSAIATELGVTPAALYHHFSSKREILFAYFEKGFEDLISWAEQTMTSDDPVERMRQLVRSYVLFDLGALEGASFNEPAIFGYYQMVRSLDDHERSRLEKLQRGFLATWRKTISDGIASGEFADDVDLDTAPFAIIGMAAHASHWFRPGKRLSASQLADRYAEYAISILQTGLGREPR